MKKLWLTIFLSVLLIFVSITGCTSQSATSSPPERKTTVWPEDFIIALIPEQNIFAQKKRYQPICDYLSKYLEYNVKTKVLESYAAIYDQMKEKKVDAGFFGSFNYTLAHAKLDIVPVARPLWLNGASTYSGYIFTRKNTGINLNIETWKGKRLALVHPYTTAGYFFPRWYLFQREINDMESYFDKVFFSGSHDTAVLAVYNREADLGAAKNHIYNKMVRENPKIGAELVVLEESRSVPSNGLAARADIPEGLRNKLKNILLNMDQNEEGKKILTDFGAISFVETNDSDYQPVRDMIAPLNIDLKTFTIGDGRHQYLGEIK